jgi:hypothetical protein
MHTKGNRAGGGSPVAADFEARQQRNLNNVATPRAQAADDAGESDLAFFRARPEAKTRIRAAYPGEFPVDLLPDARGRTLLVIVAIQRDLAGQPLHRARGLIFADEGRA